MAQRTMEKIKLLQTRIFHDNKVYLLASDIAELMEYDEEFFIEDYRDIICNLDCMPPLVLETDFNALLLEDDELFERLQHLEITKVDTLRFETEIQKGIYPLKFLFGGELFEHSAKMAGYSSVSEYINEVDYPNEIRKAFDNLRKDTGALKHYLYECEKSNNPDNIDVKLLLDNKLELQGYTRIQDGRPSYEEFIVGNGIFYHVSYDSDEIYTELRVENNELIIPEFNMKGTDIEECNIGYDPDGRDYRMHGIFENLFHILLSKKVEDAGADLLLCEDPGVKAYISSQEAFRLLNPNMFRDVLLFEGKIDFEKDTYLTEYSGTIQYK